MRFGIVLHGGSRPELSREQELAELLMKARIVRAVGPTLQAIQRFGHEVLPQCVA